jgi:hypothetical protein
MRLTPIEPAPIMPCGERPYGAGRYGTTPALWCPVYFGARSTLAPGLHESIAAAQPSALGPRQSARLRSGFRWSR